MTRTSRHKGNGCRLLCSRLLALVTLSACQVAWAGGCPAPDGASARQWQGEAAWTALAERGYHIGVVRIIVDNVYDLDDAAENTWYAHLADSLHIKTHPHVIREQLLFRPGDAVDARVIYESERRLRALLFLRYAQIEPESCAGQSVDALVYVKDAWTLKLDLEFAHVGGQNALQFLVKDVDFLGTGKSLAVGHTSDPQRSANLVTYQDPGLFGSYWQLSTGYEDLSDGHVKFFNVGQPFYSDTAPWSVQTGFFDQKENINFYNNAVLAWFASSKQDQRSIAWAHLIDWWGDTGMRAGIAYADNAYSYSILQMQNPGSLPAPVLTSRTLDGPAFTWELFQDDYASFTNIQYIGRVEDYNLGWLVDAQAGYYGRSFGSSVAAPYYNMSASWGAELPADTLLLASSYLNDRRENGVDQNLSSNLTFTLYSQHFNWQTLVGHFAGDYTLRPDPENYLYIGGLQGLRGYPNYFLIGDRRWQATFEDRILTPVQILHTLQLGFVGYADVAQIHQLSPAVWSPVYSDVGLGLRLGDLRSAFGNTVYLTVAWPLRHAPGVNGYQIVIGNIINF